MQLPQVDTTDVSELSNPVRFGQEFTGRLANPRDVLTFHRARKTARRGAAVKPEQPELSIDDPSLSNAERLGRVRVHTLVHEYLAAQELQLLGEGGMADAIGLFVEKDDPHAIAMWVSEVSTATWNRNDERRQACEQDAEGAHQRCEGAR